MSEPSILVLGVGNILLGDEGAGVRAVELLQERYRFSHEVEFIDGGTAGLELLGFLDDKKHLIIIDAIIGKEPAGTVKRMILDDPPAFFQNRISPHQLGLSEMLSCAAMTDSLPAHISLYGIIPESLETGLALSKTVAAAVEDISRQVIADLKAFGVEITRNMESVPA
ncbi:MAG: HyaD/HybD family hydrogenase maturation endopeptidase [Proteobacteria bacterium]|nr:HyaD/HybD family hydrogenase maturation endopeptidase [Pseudomonadota bacterium]MBU1639366.1 HyaD/HybD family hydrogenase maturation endopeptidase [Pseudomonadota bacterium]